MGSYFNQFDCITILYYASYVRQMRVVFEEHSNKHGLSAEDIAYAAEHIIKAQRMTYRNAEYLRFTGRHVDALMPVIGVVLKREARGVVRVYHAGSGEDSFWDIPLDDWVRRREQQRRRGHIR